MNTLAGMKVHIITEYEKRMWPHLYGEEFDENSYYISNDQTTIKMTDRMLTKLKESVNGKK